MGFNKWGPPRIKVEFETCYSQDSISNQFHPENYSNKNYLRHFLTFWFNSFQSFRSNFIFLLRTNRNLTPVTKNVSRWRKKKMRGPGSEIIFKIVIKYSCDGLVKKVNTILGWWYLSILGDTWWFLVVFGNAWWYLMILYDTRWKLVMLLWYFVILSCITLVFEPLIFLIRLTINA